MGVSTTAVPPSTSVFTTRGFWERFWRVSGIQFVGLFVVAYFVYGYQPHVGASADAVVAFYAGERTRILVAAVFGGLSVLYLLWFAAALRTALEDAELGGWGAAATASSAAVGGVFLVLIAIGAALAYSVAGAENPAIAAALNDFTWACLVLSSFPRAMLVMSGTFGFWRAGLISNSLFAAGVAALVLVLLGGTTWLSSGFWAPDGAYSRFVSPIIGVAWVLVASRVLLTRSPAVRAGW